MREIKFRGQDRDKKWHFGDLHHYWDGSVGIMEIENKYGFVVQPDTVGQFTGLYDIDGKEIFEDDICTVTETFINNNGEKRTETYIMLVRYKNYKFEFYSKTTNPRDIQYINDFCTVKVIGNIHDNHDLLKG